MHAKTVSRLIKSFALAAAVLFSASSLAAKLAWEPVPPADLALKECPSYPGAAGEVLFSRVKLDATSSGTWCDFMFRIKVYNAAGAEPAGILTVYYPRGTSVWNLSARVTKMNGSSVELDGKAFEDSVAYNSDKLKIKSKRVAVPNLESGDVVEYRYSGSSSSANSSYEAWRIQSAVPTREFTFTGARSKADASLRWFNAPNAKMINVDGYDQLVVKDLPPFIQEPFMPSYFDTGAWVALINVPRSLAAWDQTRLWDYLSAEYNEAFLRETKPNDTVKATASAIVKGVNDSNEKIKRIYDYCRTQISNLYFFDNAALQEIRTKLEKAKYEQSVEQTLSRKAGYTRHINYLFASLCRAAGFQIRVNRSIDRYFTTKVNRENGYYFMTDQLIAIRQGDQWNMYSPGSFFPEAGLIDGAYQSAAGLLCEDGKANFVTTPETPAEASARERTGHFTLDADGNLEGSVTVSYSGLAAANMKAEWYDETDEALEKGLRERILARAPAAEISDIHFSNTNGIEVPVKVSYKLRIPAYAEMAGEQMMVPPSVFEFGAKGVFSSDQRVWPIQYDYGSVERDRVEIDLPPGFALFSASNPPDIGLPTDPVHGSFKLSFKPKTQTLVLLREFYQGDHGGLLLPAAAYPALKSRYDAMKQADGHLIIIKAKPAPSTEKAPEKA